MMFWIKFAGLIACLGILAFGGYKTVDGIELDKMMDEIAEVVDDTPLIPSLDILGDDDSESSDEKHPVNPPSDGNADGGEQGDESNSAPTPNPAPDSPASGSLSTDKAVDAFAGLYDNHDPDFNEVNKEFFA